MLLLLQLLLLQLLLQLLLTHQVLSDSPLGHAWEETVLQKQFQSVLHQVELQPKDPAPTTSWGNDVKEVKANARAGSV